MSNNEVYQLISFYNQQIEALTKLVKSSSQPKQKFYSYKQASEMLGITVDGLKSRIKRGQMQRICNNNRPLIAHAEIMRFLGDQNPDGGFGAFFNTLANLLYLVRTHFVVYY
jgi:hypothetical protein